MSDSCKSCGQPIVWALTTKGRRMPIDPEPVAGGNVDVAVIAGVRHAIGTAPGEGTHVSHFSSCPDAARHRKGGRR